MLTRYGFGAIYIDDKQYKISPTFENIAKIGSPKQIVEEMKGFFNCPSINWQYYRALEILQHCCEPKLPEYVTGRFRVDARGRMKLVNPPHNDVVHDLIALAVHCLKYGVVGVTDDDSQGDGEPITEFDPYYFIGLAQEHLNKSREQAADMTLTEFIMLWDIKFPEAKKKREERLTKAEQESLFALQDELDKKAAQRRAAKSN